MICGFVGPLPRYVPLFLASCKANSDVDFLIFGDRLPNFAIADNVRLLHLGLSDLQARLEQVLGFAVALATPYKICDFRPTFGQVFQEYLVGYDFWGLCDMDMILGNVRSVITDETLREADIVTTVGDRWISGAFSLYRNTSIVNELYAASPTYQQTFQERGNRWFDESAFRWFGLRYTYEFLIENEMTVSMWDVVMEMRERGKIRLFSPNVLREHDARAPFALHWDGCRMIDICTNQEVIGHHLIRVKADPYFEMPVWMTLPDSFWIGPNGVHSQRSSLAMRPAPTAPAYRPSLLKRARSWISPKRL